MVTSPTTTYPKDLESLLETLPDLTPNDRNLIERAYNRAEQAHAGQIRKSGEPFFTHCVAVASILADLKLDAEAIAAALLHDTIEDNDNITYDDIRSEFGETIARLVNGVTKLAKLPIEQIGLESDENRTNRKIQREMEYFRKMLLTMDDDIRVVLVKLADRLHNMRTLGYMPEHKQERIAKETLEIFAPLANRLGIWQIKWELEDLSFRYLDNTAYRAIAKSLDERRQDREEYVSNMATKIRQELDNYGIRGALITARPKHIYSIYKKMSRKNLPLDQIYDVRAIRVIVAEQHECYLVLGIVHKMFRPIPGEFDDYVAAPKDNFYRSLHTAVLDDRGKTLEVQIRTWEMHEDAEFGIAAHWRYKEDRSSNDKAFEDRIAYLRRLMDVNETKDQDAETFMSRIKSEVFQDRVYAFTPQGDIIDLPVGATPIDFAYSIHTEIGHRCRGAKIHGALKSLNYKLKTGDQVEIVTAKRGGPSMDWLNEDLGYVKTHRARSKIRLWYRKQNREQHITTGRATLERVLKKLSLYDKVTFGSIADLIGYNKLENFLAAIGSGDMSSSTIIQRILDDEKKRQQENEDLLKKHSLKTSSHVHNPDGSHGVNIMGTGGLLVNLAKCCSPALGDDIIGYVTRGRGVTVHRKDCTNMMSLMDTERLIDVSWGTVSEEQTYIVPIEIIAQDREGLLRDATTVIADERINIATVSVKTRQHIATISVSLEIVNNSQLTRILTRIETIPGVYETRRTKQRA
ncbi:MAG: bifunctional (p)ppGpp synthetase/guanosine-3',5'-bis(diphosphate) 3'-pyrophosphohydrolase [Chloroflexota bacterium]